MILDLGKAEKSLTRWATKALSPLVRLYGLFKL